MGRQLVSQSRLKLIFSLLRTIKECHVENIETAQQTAELSEKILPYSLAAKESC
jgi:hypothetical protein